ncbi:hypothetical protein HK099_002409 [Clydaea vesicula]|uniref:Uncharacterized protein n=1 Tax=Clydaea vesicula TaxID=447962 RepID=A0AAD5U7K5_9FUNG|nr:hypothetical protein HK099_002409 [Clydaea vesicula]
MTKISFVSNSVTLDVNHDDGKCTVSNKYHHGINLNNSELTTINIDFDLTNVDGNEKLKKAGIKLSIKNGKYLENKLSCESLNPKNKLAVGDFIKFCLKLDCLRNKTSKLCTKLSDFDAHLEFTHVDGFVDFSELVPSINKIKSKLRNIADFSESRANNNVKNWRFKEVSLDTVVGANLLLNLDDKFEKNDHFLVHHSKKNNILELMLKHHINIGKESVDRDARKILLENYPCNILMVHSLMKVPTKIKKSVNMNADANCELTKNVFGDLEPKTRILNSKRKIVSEVLNSYTDNDSIINIRKLKKKKMVAKFVVNEKLERGVNTGNFFKNDEYIRSKRKSNRVRIPNPRFTRGLTASCNIEEMSF